MTQADLYARDMAGMVQNDVSPETITWGTGSTSFIGIVTVIDNTLAWEMGGSIQNNTSELTVPKYLNVSGTLTAQFVETSPGIWDIPKVGSQITLKAIPRRVFDVQESPDGAGWIFKLESVDK